MKRMARSFIGLLLCVLFCLSVASCELFDFDTGKDTTTKKQMVSFNSGLLTASTTNSNSNRDEVDYDIDSNISEGSSGKSKIVFAANSIVTSGNEGGQSVELIVSTYSSESSEQKKLTISAGQSFAGAIECTLKVGNETVSTFAGDSPVTITTYIAKNLYCVTVKYNGDGTQPVASSNGSNVADIYEDDDAMGTNLGYSQASGKLRFTTTHFSEFYIEAVDGNWIDSKAESYSLKDEGNKKIEIATAEELALLAYEINNGTRYSDYTITLTADIDLAGKLWTPIGGGHGDEDRGSGTFEGVFDGNGHKISNMLVSGKHDCALFGAIGIKGAQTVIKNLTIENSVSVGENHVAIVCAHALCGSIDNCKVVNCTATANYSYDGSSKKYDDGDKVSAICGYFTAEPSGYIANCSVENVTLTGYRDIGGIAGYAGTYGTTDPSVASISGCSVNDLTLINDRTHSYKTTYTTDSAFDVNAIIGEDANTIPKKDGNTSSNVTSSIIK